MFGMSCFTTQKDEHFLPAFLELFPYMHVNTLFFQTIDATHRYDVDPKDLSGAACPL